MTASLVLARPLRRTVAARGCPDEKSNSRYGPQAAFTITHASNGLFVQLTGQSALPIYAYAPDKFFAKIVDAQISFERGADGKLVALTLHQSGRDMTAPRIE